MADLGMQFVVSARRVKLVVEEPTRPLENTVMIFCNVCFEMMPHYLRDGCRVCCCCFNKVYPKTDVSDE